MTYGYLAHHGVKGMRWGVRNYQNADGSLTAEGRARYRIGNVGRFGKDHIYKLSNYDNTASVYKKGSAGGLDAIHQHRSRIIKEMKSDFKSARKSGQMSKEDYKANMKNVKSNVDKILTKEFGKSTVNKAKVLNAAETTVAILGAGLAAAYIGKLSYNIGTGIKELRQSK